MCGKVSNKLSFRAVRIWAKNVLVLQFSILRVKHGLAANGHVDISKQPKYWIVVFLDIVLHGVCLYPESVNSAKRWTSTGYGQKDFL